MQEKDQNQEYGTAGGPIGKDSSMPPCCGSGCAVCVLDYWTVEEPAPPAQEDLTEEAIPNHQSFEDVEAPADSDLLALLEAFEQAQQEVRQMLTQLDGEPK